MKYRILTNGSEFKVQRREWWNLAWSDLDNGYPLGNAKTFDTLGEAESYVEALRQDYLETKRRNTWMIIPK